MLSASGLGGRLFFALSDFRLGLRDAVRPSSEACSDRPVTDKSPRRCDSSWGVIGGKASWTLHGAYKQYAHTFKLVDVIKKDYHLQ